MWNGQTLGDKVVTGIIRPPQLGKPKIVNPASPSDLAFKDMVVFVGISNEEVKLLNKPFQPGTGNFFSNLWKLLRIRRIIKDGESLEHMPLLPMDFSVSVPITPGTPGGPLPDPGTPPPGGGIPPLPQGPGGPVLNPGSICTTI